MLGLLLIVLGASLGEVANCAAGTKGVVHTVHLFSYIASLMACIALSIVLLTIPLSDVGFKELLPFLMEGRLALRSKGFEDKFAQKFLRLKVVF